MTALRKYARLETTGLWRPLPDQQRREIVVSFGDSTLMLTDPRTQSALSHWSLPAVYRMNPGELPALFAPSSDVMAETLELSDPAMIEALEPVRGAMIRRRPRRGRLRATVVLASLAGILAAGVFWLPGAAVGHSARVVPFVKREQIGRELLGAMTRYTGAPCAAPEGLAALTRLSTRLFGANGAQLIILREGLPAGGTGHAPGHHLLADRRLVEGHDGPEVLAGHLLAERLRSEISDPLVEVLTAAGTRATFTLLATGSLPQGALAAQAQDRLRSPQAELPADQLLAAFAAARVPATPYANSVDPSGQRLELLRQRDPMPPSRAEPLMPDADWLALQSICSR